MKNSDNLKINLFCSGCKGLILGSILSSVLSFEIVFSQDFEKLDRELFKIKQERLMHELGKERRQRKRELRQESFQDKMDRLQKEKEMIRSMEINMDVQGQVGNVFIGQRFFIHSGEITPYGVVDVEKRKVGKYNINLHNVRAEGGFGGGIPSFTPPPLDMTIPPSMNLPPPPPPPPRTAPPTAPPSAPPTGSAPLSPPSPEMGPQPMPQSSVQPSPPPSQPPTQPPPNQPPIRTPR